MTKTMQIYYNAVFGAIGGLIAWLVVGVFATGDWNLWLAVTFIGAGVGLCVGSAVGIVEGAVVKRSIPRAVMGLILGGLAGVVSGLVGLLLGQVGFLLTNGGFIGRAIGWTTLGFCLGAGQGVVNLKFKRAFYGLTGGALAGLMGGIIYEGVTQLFWQQSDTAQIFLGAVGLTLIGASLGGITALSVEVIERVTGRGTLIVKTGRREGMEISVTDIVTLGSYDGCDVYLPSDLGVAKKHAQVIKQGREFLVRDLHAPGGTFVNDVRLPPGGASPPLQPGSQLRLGSTMIEFR